MSSDEWVPDDALENMIMEREYHPGETAPKTSKRLMEENAPVVAQSMIHLALHSQNERTRLDAGKYILDRVMGRVGEEILPKEDSPIEQFISEVANDIDTLVKGGLKRE